MIRSNSIQQRQQQQQHQQQSISKSSTIDNDSSTSSSSNSNNIQNRIITTNNSTITVILPKTKSKQKKSSLCNLFSNNKKNRNTIQHNQQQQRYSTGRHNNNNKRHVTYIILLFCCIIIFYYCYTYYNITRKNNLIKFFTMSNDDTTLLVPTTTSTHVLLEQRIQQSPFYTMYKRAKEFQQFCIQNHPNNFVGFDNRNEMLFDVKLKNETVASLPSFGIVDDIESYYSSTSITNNTNEQCTIPPKTECAEHQITVIFMAYNPDRLDITLREIKNMFHPNKFYNLISNIIIVWNGSRNVNESQSGIELLNYIQYKNNNKKQDKSTIRIVYPLLEKQYNLVNDLMNRYHPQLLLSTIQTKCILYYDDDGPFYSYTAILSGFELWKRHSHQQIGAMSRQLTYSTRQQKEYTQKTNNTPTDTKFISHCSYSPTTNNSSSSSSSSTGTTKLKGTTTTNVDEVLVVVEDTVNDYVEYDFHYFANYDANMVLPSGSMIHVNYLCFIWHPLFMKIRQFVLNHPVHPDDMTVSIILSQLSNTAPRVYSRKIKPAIDIDDNTDTDSTSTSTSRIKNTRQRKVRAATAATNKKYRRKQRRILLQEQDEEDAYFSTTNSNFKATTNRYHNRTIGYIDDIDDDSDIEEDTYDDDDDDDDDDGNRPLLLQQEQELNQYHRKLLFNINWDAKNGNGMNEKKLYWANLRKEAINSLIRYFGSINSGSIGWCTSTSKYYSIEKKFIHSGKCNPIFAPINKMSWMNTDGTPKLTCP